MAARVIVIDGTYYVAFEQTGDFKIHIRCRSEEHAFSVANAFNLNS